MKTLKLNNARGTVTAKLQAVCRELWDASGFFILKGGQMDEKKLLMEIEDIDIAAEKIHVIGSILHVLDSDEIGHPGTISTDCGQALMKLSKEIRDIVTDSGYWAEPPPKPRRSTGGR